MPEVPAGPTGWPQRPPGRRAPSFDAFANGLQSSGTRALAARMTHRSDRILTVDLRSAKGLAEDLSPARRGLYIGALWATGAVALVVLTLAVLSMVTPRSLPFTLSRAGDVWIVCDVADASLGLQDNDIVVSVHGAHIPGGTQIGRLNSVSRESVSLGEAVETISSELGTPEARSAPVASAPVAAAWKRSQASRTFIQNSALFPKKRESRSAVLGVIARRAWITVDSPERDVDTSRGSD